MNKEKRIKILIIFVLTTSLAFLVLKVVNYIRNKEKRYEYALNGQIFESKECWLDGDICFCEKSNKIIRVDNYYLKED